MKVLAIALLSIGLNSSIFASEAKKDVKPLKTEKMVTSTTTKKEADCDKPKDEFLKKIEAEKKARAEAGKGLSLQGAKDTGCSL